MKTPARITLLLALLATSANASTTKHAELTWRAPTTTMADFVDRGGTCKGLARDAVLATRELQHQLNRAAGLVGLEAIDEDGDIGAKTLALFGRVQTLSGGAIMGDSTTCMGVAPDADVLGEQLRLFADELIAAR
ncbi:MAG: hypothetical protein ACKV2T_09210 [Kofleriaceae bacterium]